MLAYHLTKLDTVALALPLYVQVIVAASMALWASVSVALFHKLTLKVAHAVLMLPLQIKITHLSPARLVYGNTPSHT